MSVATVPLGMTSHELKDAELPLKIHTKLEILKNPQ
jgi:hypothetical protein